MKRVSIILRFYSKAKGVTNEQEFLRNNLKVKTSSPYYGKIARSLLGREGWYELWHFVVPCGAL